MQRISLKNKLFMSDFRACGSDDSIIKLDILLIFINDKKFVSSNEQNDNYILIKNIKNSVCDFMNILLSLT